MIFVSEYHKCNMDALLKRFREKRDQDGLCVLHNIRADPETLVGREHKRMRSAFWTKKQRQHGYCG